MSLKTDFRNKIIEKWLSVPIATPTPMPKPSPQMIWYDTEMSASSQYHNQLLKEILQSKHPLNKTLEAMLNEF